MTLDPPRVTTYEIGQGDRYRVGDTSERLAVSEPFEVDLSISEPLPPWAKDS